VDNHLYHSILSYSSHDQDDIDFTPPISTSTSTSASLSLPPYLLFYSSASETTATRLTTPAIDLNPDDILGFSNSYFNQQAWKSVFAIVCDKGKPPLYQSWSSSGFSSSSLPRSASPALAVPFVFDPFGCDDGDASALISVQSNYVGGDTVKGLLRLGNDDASIEHGVRSGLTDSVPFVFTPIGLPDEDSLSNMTVAGDRDWMRGVLADNEGDVAPTSLSEAVESTDPVPAVTIANVTSTPNAPKCVMSWTDFDDDDLDTAELDTAEDTAFFTVLEHNGITYTITGELGRGAYGQVVFARTSLGEEVAIKITSKVTTGSDTADKLRRFVLNERNILVRIAGNKSPYLTKPLACFQDEDNVFFVMVGFFFPVL
jgi:hypothetical protein